MVAPPAVSVALDADYDADALALTDGDPVGTWTSATGSAAALLQATAGSQPTYRTSVLATGHAGVELDGSSDFMVADYDQQMPWSAVAIFVTDANDGVIFGSTNNSFKGGLFLDAGQLAYESHGSDLFDGAVSTGAAHVGVGVWNFTDASVRLDGGTPLLGDAGTRQRLGLKLGNEESDLNREPFTGTILRLLFFAGGLTEADIVTLDTWVQDTYGIPVADYTGGGTPDPATATLAATLPALTAAAAAAVPIDTTLAATLPSPTAAASADVPATGNLAATLPGLTAAATGSVDWPTATADLDATLPPLTATAAAHTPVDADLDATLPALAAALTGNVGNDATATLDAVLPTLTAALAATAPADADLTAVLPALAAVAEAEAIVAAELEMLLPSLTADLAGTSDAPQTQPRDITITGDTLPVTSWADTAPQADTFRADTPPTTSHTDTPPATAWADTTPTT